MTTKKIHRVPEITMKWGDGEYTFRLPIKLLIEMERVCGAGTGTIVQRVMAGQPTMADLTEISRLGLIGGGVKPARALELVELYVHGQPIAAPDDPSSPLATAQMIMQAVWIGLTAPPAADDESGAEIKGDFGELDAAA